MKEVEKQFSTSYRVLGGMHAFATEAEQIRKFENDEVAQHYFEVLRTLISKIHFAQQVGLKEVANYLGKFYSCRSQSRS